MNTNFIHEIIDCDLEKNKNEGKVITRFPPEPNGYLHLGHAKSICLNFRTAEKYKGICNLRMDDTNPEKENDEYIQSIKKAVCWLGFDWGERLFYASDYFEKFYQFAVELIKQGKAFVCDLTVEQIREYRGTLTEPGKESPYRNRSVEENLALFEQMRDGKFSDGAKVLRAKIDMKASNINLRDPIMYRIRHKEHPRTQNKWCIYPMYDYAHCVSDAIEGITHSLCTLEFEDHRPLYDWYLDQIKELPHPHQIEFARLNLTYTVMSKRKLLELVDSRLVSGWDDPRMPTLLGVRRRGYPPEAIVEFCNRIGVTKQESTVEIGYLEECIRENLNQKAPRRMVVLNPLKITITNFPQNTLEYVEVPNHPKDESMGIRKVAFAREIYIEKEDFSENPPKGFFRLSPGAEVRLRSAYIIRCQDVIKDDNGSIIELLCTYDPESRGGNALDGRKVKGTLHWVAVHDSVSVEVRLYDRLFTVPNPQADKNRDFKEYLNKNSLQIVYGKGEMSLKESVSEERFQFERIGYFNVDYDSTAMSLKFNRIVSLKNTWENSDKQK